MARLTDLEDCGDVWALKFTPDAHGETFAYALKAFKWAIPLVERTWDEGALRWRITKGATTEAKLRELFANFDEMVKIIHDQLKLF